MSDCSRHAFEVPEIKRLRMLEPQGSPDVIECDGVDYIPTRKSEKSIKPCPCGGRPKVMVNSQWDAFVVCTSCSRKGRIVNRFTDERIGIVEFVSRLQAASLDAIELWNEEVSWKL